MCASPSQPDPPRPIALIPHHLPDERRAHSRLRPNPPTISPSRGLRPPSSHRTTVAPGEKLPGKYDLFGGVVHVYRLSRGLAPQARPDVNLKASKVVH